MMEQKIIHILYTKISAQLPEDIYKNYLIFLPESLRDQHFRYKRWQDRTANLLSKILLIKGLQKFGLDYNSLELLNYNQYGRPHLSGNIDFNISHSGDFIVCALGENIRLGIDIEEIKPVDFTDFEYMMTAGQWEMIKNSPNPLKEFFNFWAIKESIIKADGRGLSVPLNDIVIIGQNAYYENNWFLTKLEIDGKYCASLASNFENSSIKLEFTDLNISEPENPGE